VEEWGASAQLDWDIGGVNLTSITSYRDWDALRNQDVDFSIVDIGYRDGLTIGFESFTQEIRLQGEAGRFNWLVGAFYGDEKLDTTDRIRLGADVNNYINILTMGGTAGLTTAPHPLLGGISGPPVTGPFQFFDSTGGDDDNPQLNQAGNPQAPGAPQDPVESIFYFAGLGGFNPFPNVPMLATSNSLLQNAYLTPGPAGVGQVADNWTVDTKSLALFTHNEIALTDRLTWTIGLRYSSETKDLNADLNVVNPTCLSMQGLEAATEASVPGPGGIVSALAGSSASIGTLVTFACNPAVNPIANGVRSTDREENEFSGTTSLAYHVSEDMMIYGGYSRGYKSGGFNVDRSGLPILPWQTSAAGIDLADLGFDPEFTDAYELGVKSTLFGGSTDFNVNLFYEVITDYQNNSFNGTNFITRNVPETISKGVEIDFLSRPTDQLTLQGGMLYNEAYYNSTVAYAATPGNTIFSGDPLDHAPEWSFTGAVTYEQPLAENLSATFYLDGRWNSEYRNQTLSRDPRTDQEAFAVFNGNVAIGNPNGRWAVELWGRNLADEYYTVGAFQATFQSGTFVVYPGEPRTYGITVRTRY
jgi:iron complex outermembrane receptor protein